MRYRVQSIDMYTELSALVHSLIHIFQTIIHTHIVRNICMIDTVDLVKSVNFVVVGGGGWGCMLCIATECLLPFNFCLIERQHQIILLHIA